MPSSVHLPVGAFVEIFGLPPSTAVGKLCTEVVPADYDDPAWRAHLDDLAHHRPYRDFEVTLIDASGVSRPVKISGTPCSPRTARSRAISGSATT